MKISVYIATSLDGFIARQDGSLDWLEGAEPDSAEHDQSDPDPSPDFSSDPSPDSADDFGFHAFFDQIDVLVMGRNTYEKVRSFGDWPYGDKPVVVLSSRPVDIPPQLTHTTWRNAEPTALVEELRTDGASHLYVDGANTIQRFLNENLITDLTITRAPVLLGAGIALFGPLARGDIQLEHVSTEAFPNGYVMSSYKVKK